MSRRGEFVAKILAGPDADHKQASAVLSETIALGVKHFPRNAISRGTKTDELISEEVIVLRESHAIDILDDKCKGFDVSKGAVIFPVKEVDLVAIVAAPSLAVTLAGVAPSQDIRFWELAYATDVAGVHGTGASNAGEDVASRLVDLVSPDRIDTCSAKANVTATASGKK